MNTPDLKKYLKHPEDINASDIPLLQEILERYPYFEAVHFLYLKALYQQNNFKFNEQLKQSVAQISNRKQLLFFLKYPPKTAVKPTKEEELIPEVETEQIERIKNESPRVGAEEIKEQKEIEEAATKEIKKEQGLKDNLQKEAEKEENSKTELQELKRQENQRQEKVKEPEPLSSRAELIEEEFAENKADELEEEKISVEEEKKEGEQEKLEAEEKGKRQEKTSLTPKEAEKKSLQEDLKDLLNKRIAEIKAKEQKGTSFKEGKKIISKTEVTAPDDFQEEKSSSEVAEDKPIIPLPKEKTGLEVIAEKESLIDENILDLSEIIQVSAPNEYFLEEELEVNKLVEQAETEKKEDKKSFSQWIQQLTKKNSSEKEEGSLATEKNEGVKQKGNIDKVLIDNFLASEESKIIRPKEEKETQTKQHLVASINTDKSAYMSDTLAQIYVKQGHFDKAIEAYEKLSLKNPKKNTYFANQIKKIQVLKINS